MSPAAAAMAALLHAAVALAFLWELPRVEAESAEQALEFTVDVPVPAPPESPPQQAAAATPPPAAPPPAAPPPSASPVPPPRLGLAPSRSLTPDPSSRQETPPGPASSRPTRTTEPAREPAREPAKPEPPKPEPEQQQAAAAPPPPPPPPPETKLEQALPPLEAPPPPLSARDFPKIAPPPPPKAPPPPQRAQTPPPPPQRQALQPSPLAGGQRRPPADSQAAAQPAPSPLTNPASQYGQRKAEEDYLWRVAQKLSQHQQFVKNVSTESGSVVLRLTIARDGTLIDVSMFKSSGLPALDATALNMIRQASPYPPFPPDITGTRQNFLLPLQFRRSD